MSNKQKQHKRRGSRKDKLGLRDGNSNRNLNVQKGAGWEASRTQNAWCRPLLREGNGDEGEEEEQVAETIKDAHHGAVTTGS